MDARHWVILAIANLAVIGCRYHDPSIDLLESELRWMEDQLYLMEDEVQAKQRQLDLCKTGQLGKTPFNSSRNKWGNSKTQDDASRELLPPGDDDPSLLEPPQIDLPRPSDDSGLSPTPAKRSSTGEPGDANMLPLDSSPPADGLFSPPIIESPSAQMMESGPTIVQQSFESPLEDQEFDPYVTHIVVHSQLTGGYDFDGRPTADGLLVLVEPRNADGRYVPLPGAISVVALDTAQKGPAARIARWDFDAAEVGRHLRKSSSGRGVHLELPWPDEVPETSHFRVFARYVTADGRKLQADHETDGDAVHATVRGWTPAKHTRRAEPISAAPASSDKTPQDSSVVTASASLAARSASVLAITEQLEKSVTAMEETLADPSIPRPLTPPTAARPLRVPKNATEKDVQRPQWQPSR